MAILYSFSFCVLSLGVAVCVIKSPASLAKDYLEMATLYEGQMGEAVHQLSQEDLIYHLKRQEKLLSTAQSLDPSNSDISKKREALNILKLRLRERPEILANSSQFNGAIMVSQ